MRSKIKDLISIDKLPNLLSILIISVLLMGCSAINNKSDLSTYNYTPMIHNEYSDLDKEEILSLIDDVYSIVLVDSSQPDETVFVYNFYDDEEIYKVSKTKIVEGMNYSLDEYTLYLSHDYDISHNFGNDIGKINIYYSGEAQRTGEVNSLHLSDGGKSQSLNTFIQKDEILPTLKFIDNIYGELIAFLDVVAIDDYVKFKTQEHINEDDDYVLPTPINTKKEESYDIELLNDELVEKYPVSLFEGIKPPSGYQFIDWDEVTNMLHNIEVVHFRWPILQIYDSYDNKIIDTKATTIYSTNVFKFKNNKYVKGTLYKLENLYDLNIEYYLSFNDGFKKIDDLEMNNFYNDYEFTSYYQIMPFVNLFYNYDNNEAIYDLKVLESYFDSEIQESLYIYNDYIVVENIEELLLIGD